MKILHIADTHLGYSAYSRVTEENINQREMDNYNSFKQFIDYALKIKPDIILHAGDLFDSVRPNNRAITFAIQQIIRLSKNKIPFVVIAGNHEHPKLKETGHIFRIFDHIEYIYPIYNSIYEKLQFIINNKKITIHAIPQTTSKEDYSNCFKKINIDQSSNYNILITHGSVKGVKDFTMNEFNELIIPERFLKSDFDYIALGHYHKYTKLSERVYYSGSTESLTFSDAGDIKGFIELKITNKKFNQKFIKLRNRIMVDSNPIRCTDLTLDTVMKKIKEKIGEINPKDKVFRIKLNDISSHLYRGIDFNEIKEMSKEAIHYEIKADLIKDKNSNLNENSKIDDLIHEYELFINSNDIEEKEILMNLGIKYIEKIMSKDEGK